ncbi:hypothetical protein PRK78_005293 [Emydomyces testavorans]|uniref:Aminoglycoside phosphotransferase domain-containing protein n=1 Tax=Emydomyces testavorans TaxID=2070801 RepID=A0AAF0DKE8_9EURO|nr:hypothetical protein PRK78_005293 [Emydomyces testavorans]
MGSPTEKKEEFQHEVIQSDQASSNSENKTAFFSAVLSNLNLEHLPAFCVSVRKALPDFSPGTPIEPVNVDSVLFGSFHALYPIQFQHGVRWILKVPACGTPEHFNSSAASALQSEALTMRLIRRKTSVPVPDVIAFDATLENTLGCPFILMTYIQGIPLYDCWFDQTISKEELMSRRTRTLEGVAHAMAELGRFSFPIGGALTFDQNGNLSGPGPMRFMDHRAMLEQMKDDDEDEMAIYFEAGPFLEAKNFYLLSLNRAKEPENPVHKGMERLLRMFLSWIPEPQGTGFVLTHPDLDIQNVIVSEDGSLKGLIDWDNVAAVPCFVGNERYPSWLTRDWDPAMYAWNEDMEKGIEPDTLWEDSPDTLALHRKQYNDFMQHCLSLQKNSAQSFSPFQASSTTSKSLFVENLLIAAENPVCTYRILNKIFEKVHELAAQSDSKGMNTEAEKSNDPKDDDFGSLSFFETTDALAKEEAKKEMIDFLRRGFEALFNQVC